MISGGKKWANILYTSKIITYLQESFHFIFRVLIWSLCHSQICVLKYLCTPFISTIITLFVHACWACWRNVRFWGLLEKIPFATRPPFVQTLRYSCSPWDIFAMNLIKRFNLFRLSFDISKKLYIYYASHNNIYTLE